MDHGDPCCCNWPVLSSSIVRSMILCQRLPNCLWAMLFMIMAVSVQALLTDATNLNKIQKYRPVNTVFLYCSVLPRSLSSAESRPRDKRGGGGGGEKKGGGGGAPRAPRSPSLDLPLLRLGWLSGFIHWKIVAALLKNQRFNRMKAYVDIWS